MKTYTNIHIEKTPRLEFDFSGEFQWIALHDGDEAHALTVFVPQKHFHKVRAAVDAFNAVMADAERQSLLAAE